MTLHNSTFLQSITIHGEQNSIHIISDCVLVLHVVVVVVVSVEVGVSHVGHLSQIHKT